MNEERVITSPVLAESLLKKDYKIIDIRPNKYNRRLSVFAFNYKEGIDELIQEYRQKMIAKKESKIEVEL
ncbi:hypothetical protein [Clostridium sp. KNHs214]|uniref:hypothetical protein n=1 Tax=Clostridium sp. KNHs214 TaxID=1540257 RepID=UPI0005526DDE|nr:hypothetical protein [Clostridium sp. KNHs214]